MKPSDVPAMVRRLARYRDDGQWTFQRLTAKMWGAQNSPVIQAQEIITAIAGELDAMNREADAGRRARGKYTSADAYKARRDWLDAYYSGVGDDSVSERKTRTGDMS